jgi:hypothetical protein
MEWRFGKGALAWKAIALDLLALSLATLLWVRREGVTERVRHAWQQVRRPEASIVLPLSGVPSGPAVVGMPLTLRIETDPSIHENMRVVEVELDDGLRFYSDKPGQRETSRSLASPDSSTISVRVIADEPGPKTIHLRFLNEFRGVLFVRTLRVEFLPKAPNR